MPNILLLDTNFSSKPIYDFLNREENKVFVLGGNTNDYLAKTCENYFCLDYSNIEKCKKFIEDHDIDYIVPGCNDFSYNVCSKLNSDLNFPGIDKEESIEKLHNKEKFREFSKNIGLHVPEVFNISNQGIKYPVIVKPVDSYSGRGNTVIKFHEKNLLNSSIEKAKSFSPSKRFIIEEFVEGNLFSHSAFIRDGKILIDFFVEEHCTANPFTVDTSRVVKNLPANITDGIRKDVQKMVDNLSLADGLIHTQFISNKNNFWIIEVTRRCPGDLYSLLIEISTGFRYSDLYASFFIEERISIDYNLIEKNIIRHTISSREPRIFKGINFSEKINLIKFLPLCSIGEKMDSSPFSRSSLVFIDGGDEFNEIFQILLERKLYTFE